MKKYFCDVCGTELCAASGAASSVPAVKLCRLEDLCPRCEGLAQALDVPALVLEELRQRAEAAQAEPEAVLTGRGAREKSAILAAVEAFRREHGPGAAAELARMAGVEEGVLRDMRSRQKVPLSEWRKVGKALGVAQGKEEA